MKLVLIIDDQFAPAGGGYPGFKKGPGLMLSASVNGLRGLF
ncbi:hypothetical protein QW131_21050 [Roseibium salinum]|nr:hypothetical protein [Roseibium salinum]